MDDFTQPIASHPPPPGSLWSTKLFSEELRVGCITWLAEATLCDLPLISVHGKQKGRKLRDLDQSTQPVVVVKVAKIGEAGR